MKISEEMKEAYKKEAVLFQEHARFQFDTYQNSLFSKKQRMDAFLAASESYSIARNCLFLAIGK